MKGTVHLYLKEAKYKDIDGTLILEYSRKRDKIGEIAKKLGFEERRDGRGIRYTGINDKINYCLAHSKNRYKEFLKKEVENIPQIQNDIVMNYLKLVVSIAGRYSSRRSDLDDIVQEGSNGLLYALDKFDPKRGFKFTTYATYWIEQHIRRYLGKNSDAVKIPAYIQEKIHQLSKSDKENIADMSISDIEENLSLKRENARNIWLALRFRNAISLDQKIGEDETPLESLIGKNDAEIPDNIWIKDFLQKLGKNERIIITSRYMLNYPMTLQAIGKKLGLSRERVRQIETKALRKIRGYHNNLKSI